MPYTVKIELNDVAEGDVTELAQEVWDDYAEDFDASRGDFKLSISKDGFPIDWMPKDAA